MVGWSRRAREASERRARYTAWFNSLPVDEQVRIQKAEEERWERDKWKFFLALILGLGTLFVGLPLLGVYGAQMRADRSWREGKVISTEGGKVCKEIEYCAPCMPVHHWHKRVECR